MTEGSVAGDGVAGLLCGLGPDGLSLGVLLLGGIEPVRHRGRASRGNGQGHQRTFLRLAQAGPDAVQLVLVVQGVQPEEEAEHQADPAVAGAFHARVFLHLGDPLAGPVDRHVRRDDDDPADRDGQQGQHRLHRDVLVEVACLAVDLVPPDEVVDAQREEGPDQPGQPDVPGLARRARRGGGAEPCLLRVSDRGGFRGVVPPGIGRRGGVRRSRVSSESAIAGGSGGSSPRAIADEAGCGGAVSPPSGESPGGSGGSSPGLARKPADLVRQTGGGQRG